MASVQPSAPRGAESKRRRVLAAAVPLLLAVGIAARFGLSGTLADAAGGVFYTAFAYVLIALLAPRLRPAVVAALALAFSVAVELLQLTSIPASLADWWSPLRLAFGTTFHPGDLPPYVTGAALAFVADRVAQRRMPARRQRSALEVDEHGAGARFER